MGQLTLDQFTLDQFSWHEDGRVLSAMASDLSLPPGRWPEKIYIKGMKVVEFNNPTARQDKEGDTLYMVYLPSRHSTALGTVNKLFIWND